MPNCNWMAVMSALCLSLATLAEQPKTTEPPATGFLYKTITIDDETYAYCVYVPPGYTPKKAWPCILFLHGSGECGRDGFLQTDVGIGRVLRRQHDRIPALVVMPQCRPKHDWLGPMARMALRCLEQTSREYHLDRRRVYLTGLSLGGQGAWHLAAEHPKLFAAVVSICGFAELGPSSAAVPRLAERLAGVPIWCFHGARDENVPVVKTREMVEAIRAAGGRIHYTEYPDGTHLVWDRVYENRELWRWLFEQKRSAKRSEPRP